MQNSCGAEIETVFEKFGKLRDAYIVQKAYNENQEELLTFERQQSLTMREKLLKATKAFLALEKVHNSSVEQFRQNSNVLLEEKKKLEEENDLLKRSVEQLQERCDHFRALQDECNQDRERIWKLEEEIEVLKSRLELQEDTHREDILSLKKRHIQEMLKYKSSFESARQKFRDSQRSHSKKGSSGAFRWPRLEVEKINATQTQDEEDLFEPSPKKIIKRSSMPIDRKKEEEERIKKKDDTPLEAPRRKIRKLFHQDVEELFDLYDIQPKE